MPRQRSLPAPPPETEATGAPDKPTPSTNDVKRVLCSRLELWTICGTRRCRRTRGCAGDAAACFARYWATVPEDLKLHCHAIIEGRLQGLTPDDAIAYADNKLAQFRAIEAQFAVTTKDRANPSAVETPAARGDAPEPDDAPAMPRLRSV